MPGCRPALTAQNADGHSLLFDVYRKPNMTGPGRPCRDDQLSVTGMAASAVGMSYTDLLLTMLRGAWISPRAQSGKAGCYHGPLPPHPKDVPI